jgi:hypothetical protein
LGWVVFHDRADIGRYPVTPKDTLATFGCARHTGNDGYCVALDDLLAHADEVPGTCAEPFETAPGCGSTPSCRADSGVSGARKPFSGCYVKKPVDALFRVGNPYLRAI